MSNGLFGDGAAHLGKSARTRARLMDAAVELFARDGFEAASVNEIARRADVANGTFYVHFRDKNEIASQVALAIAGSVTRQLDEAMSGIEDAVERTSMGTRRFIDLVGNAPDWGRALLRALWTFQALRNSVAGHLRDDLERGVAQGAFDVQVDPVLIDVFVSMVMSGLFGRLSGSAPEDIASRVAELQLRMLGVPADRARTVSRQDLPPISLSLVPTST
jgi:AcrR family transcriptional regulator